MAARLRRGRAAAAALAQPESTRAAPRLLASPRRTVLTSRNSPEKATQGFLKFLALGQNNDDGALPWLFKGTGRGMQGTWCDGRDRKPGAGPAAHRRPDLTPRTPYLTPVPSRRGRLPQPGN